MVHAEIRDWVDKTYEGENPPGRRMMRIESSQVAYLATHRSTSTSTVTEEPPRRGHTLAANAAAVDTVEFQGRTGLSATGDYGGSQDLDPKQRLARMVIEALFGYQIRWFNFHAGTPTAASGAPASPREAIVRQRTELHTESEQTSFQARGVVDTADGRSIQFAATLTMQRRFQSFTATTEANSTTDPLVVNFGGRPAQLTEAKIAFDLNTDGSLENMSFVADGSGFLVLDKNGDGTANDGSELFGTQTGNGFAELAAYDGDHNGWIDENDGVFTRLRVWTRDGVATLPEKGIGAIAVSSIATPFAIKDAANSLEGNVRSSGIYLSEDGTAGTIQQVDLAIG